MSVADGLHLGGSSPLWRRVRSGRAAIAELLQAFIGHRVTGWVAGQGFTLQPTGIDDAHVSWRVNGVPPSHPFQLVIEGYNTVFSMKLTIAGHAEGILRTERPDEILELRQRWLRRGPSTTPMVIAWRDPEGQSHGGRVVNLSYEGLLAELLGPPTLNVSQRLTAVEVSSHGGSVTMTGEVVSLEEASDHTKLRMIISGVQPRWRWHEWVDRALNPKARVDAAVAAAQWRLFERCGYFSLSNKSPADFAHLQRAYLTTSQVIGQAEHLLKQVVWGAQGDAELTAAATMAKVYAGTWIGIHMAKDKGDAPDGTPSRQVLRELNALVFECIQTDPELKWFFTSIQDKRVWTRSAFHDFPQTLSTEDEAAQVRFRALEFGVDAPWFDQTGPQGCLREATDQDLDALCSHISDTRSYVYREALDLVRDRIDMATNVEQWRRVALERERKTWVAGNNPTNPDAAAVVERAADGVHLFGLFDLVRLYDLSGNGQPCFSRLLAQAADYFAASGKARFVCYLEKGIELDPSVEALGTDLGEADMCIIAARRIPEVVENIFRLAAPTRSEDRSG